MKIYIAASFTSRDRIRPLADKLWQSGYEIVSTWINETKRPSEMDMTLFHRKLAIKDLAEVKSADLLIVDTLDSRSGGGKSVEFGFALGKFQTTLIYRVGPATNVFHQLVDGAFDNWDQLIDYLEVSHAVHSSERT